MHWLQIYRREGLIEPEVVKESLEDLRDEHDEFLEFREILLERAEPTVLLSWAALSSAVQEWYDKKHHRRISMANKSQEAAKIKKYFSSKLGEIRQYPHVGKEKPPVGVYGWRLVSSAIC